MKIGGNKSSGISYWKTFNKRRKIKVEFRLWDLAAAKEMTALAFTTTPSNWRRVAHIISDKIYEDLQENKDILIQNNLYRKCKKPKSKKTAIMDQDGFNTKYLTLGNERLTPRFNPTNQMVTLCLILETYKSLLA